MVVSARIGLLLTEFWLEDIARENTETSRGLSANGLSGGLDENGVVRHARGESPGRRVQCDQRFGVGYRRTQLTILSG